MGRSRQAPAPAPRRRDDLTLGSGWPPRHAMREIRINDALVLIGKLRRRCPSGEPRHRRWPPYPKKKGHLTNEIPRGPAVPHLVRGETRISHTDNGAQSGLFPATAERVPAASRRMPRSDLLAACHARGYKRMGQWDCTEVSNVHSRGLSGLGCCSFRESRFDPEPTLSGLRSRNASSLPPQRSHPASEGANPNLPQRPPLVNTERAKLESEQIYGRLASVGYGVTVFPGSAWTRRHVRRYSLVCGAKPECLGLLPETDHRWDKRLATGRTCQPRHRLMSATRFDVMPRATTRTSSHQEATRLLVVRVAVGEVIMTRTTGGSHAGTARQQAASVAHDVTEAEQ